MKEKIKNIFAKNGFERVILILLILWGVVYSVLLPTWQVPDEYAHYKMIADAVDNPGLLEKLTDDVGISLQYSTKVDYEALKNAMTKAPDYSRSEVMPDGISFSVIKHLPATVGMYIGILIGLPTFWVFQLCELFSLLFYAFICYKALCILPVNKEVMAMIMLLPIALQQGASVSYDSVLIPLCIYLISYFMYLKYTKNEIATLDVGIVLVLWALITYLKMPYTLLILLVFTLPLDKYDIKIYKLTINKSLIKKIWPILVILGVVGSAGVIYIMRNNFYMKIFIAAVLEWKRTLYLLQETLRTYSEFLMVSSVGYFGWFAVRIPVFVSLIAYILMIYKTRVNCDAIEKSSKIKDYIVIWGTFAALAVVTTLSMVNHTYTIFTYGYETTDVVYNAREALYKIPWIGGLQGRYYVPFLFLFFLPMGRVRRAKTKVSYGITIAVSVALLLLGCKVLLDFYWMAG